ncbi:MAG: BLUF domain-containing protein [Deltaproteobacteria bacterium]|nr:BLUF domain-containing protein [Deltaproteobacteria bacterium]MBW2530051.1 BLUF domain-containing protein [Deltaproteobacteria bacterium]
MKRIRYISEFAAPMTAEQISELARRSAENNQRDDITGMLVASGSIFFQLIEGPDEAIDSLFRRIQADDRHHNVLLLGIEQGDLKRVCPDWAMAKADVSELTQERVEPIRAMLRAIVDHRRAVQNLSDALEEVMWRELIDAETESLKH